MKVMKRRKFFEQLIYSTGILVFPFNIKSFMSPHINIVPSTFSVTETINSLVAFLQENGAIIYERIDQQNELQQVGIVIRPYQVILFGNPKSGGPILQVSPLAGMDLPLKVICWEDEQRKVWLGYKDIFHFALTFELPAKLILNLDLGPVIKSALQ